MAVSKSPSEQYQQSAVVIVDNGEGSEEEVNLWVLSNKAIKALAKDSGLKVKAMKKQDMIDEIMNQTNGSKLTIQNEEEEGAANGTANQKIEGNYAGVIITNKNGQEEELNLHSLEIQAVKKLALDSGLQITKENKVDMINEMMEQINEAYQNTEEVPAENNNEESAWESRSEKDGERNKALAGSSFLSEAAAERFVRDIRKKLVAQWKDEMYRDVEEELKQRVTNDFMENSWEALKEEIKTESATNNKSGKKASSIKARTDK